MTTVDFRTRWDGDSSSFDPSAFFDVLATPLEDRAEEAAKAAARLGLPDLTFDIDGRVLTLARSSDRLVVDQVEGNGLVVSLDAPAFSDLVQDVSSTFALQMTGRAQVRRGVVEQFVAWEPVLRWVLDGRPVYAPGTVAFIDRDGAPLDLTRSFSLGDDPAEIGHFLAQAGFLHLRDVFSGEEMASVSAELDAAIAAARPDDGASWWARTDEGEHPARILGFNRQSPSLRVLLHDERFTRIGTLTDDSFVQRDPDNSDAAEGLLKKTGVTEGISDVSWHKDCAMGGHSRHCCGLTVGISVTGAGRENGELGVVAGSHRANVAPLGIDTIDLPRLPVTTRTGDVTVHCSCTLHMSRPPVSAERRVVYTGFGLAPRAGDRPVVVGADEARRGRAALNDHVKRHQADLQYSPSASGSELP